MYEGSLETLKRAFKAIQIIPEEITGFVNNNPIEKRNPNSIQRTVSRKSAWKVYRWEMLTDADGWVFWNSIKSYKKSPSFKLSNFHIDVESVYNIQYLERNGK